MKRRSDVELRIYRATNEIIAVIGDLRSVIASPSIADGDRKYLEREIDRLQATTHRIATFAEEVEKTKH